MNQKDEQNRNHSSNDKENSSDLFLDSNNRLQTPEEHERDQHTDPHANEKVRPSADDLHPSDADKYGASNRNNNTGGL